MTDPTPEQIREVFSLATGVALRGKVSGKTAVRRVVGTAEWRHDPERVAAAEAKRERRRARNRRNV
jgi:hypothetical protein